MLFRHQKLEIYQLAKKMTLNIYDLTGRLPDDEKYVLIAQIRRAAISVPSNIAEGYSKYTEKDKLKYINIAYASLMEVSCQVELAYEIGYISKACCDKALSEIKDLSIKMNNLANKLRSGQVI